MVELTKKFKGEELEKIKLFLPLRKNKKIGDIIVYEALVKDIVALENGNLDIPTLLHNSTNLTKEEIDYLPFSLYMSIRDTIINFEDEKDESEGIKKN